MEYQSIITWYENVIDDLHDILKIVPYNKTNKSVVIPRLSSIIIESGSLLDTVFFSLYKGKNKKPNIVNYKEYYENKINLSSIKTLFYAEEPVILQPFKCWSIIKSKKSAPKWWDSYNSLKHDRSNSMKESSLENAVNITTGLTQFLARNVEFFDALYRKELIISSTNPESIRSDYNKYWTNTHCDVSLENNLYLTPYGKNIFKSKDEINTYIIYSNKIKKYFAKWG